MKHFIFTVFVFGAFSLFVYSALLVIAGSFLHEGWRENLVYRWPHQQKLFSYSRYKDADTAKNIDILILGSSHACKGYDSRLFLRHSWRVINLGSGAQTFIQTEFLVKRYLDRLKPKFVIFDIYPLVFSNDGVESGLDIIANTKFDSNILAMAVKLNNIKIYNTLVYAIYQDVIPEKSYADPKKTEMGSYIKGGYVENFDEFNLTKPLASRPYSIHKNQLAAFKNIVQTLIDHNVPYVLTQAPMTKLKYRSITNNNAIDQMLSSYGVYYNFNKIINIPLSGFADEDHLNQYGVNLFNAKLINLLGDTITRLCKKDISQPDTF